MRYEYFRDTQSQWRWRFKASNGKIIAVSSESYVSMADCLHAIRLVQGSAAARIHPV